MNEGSNVFSRSCTSSCSSLAFLLLRDMGRCVFNGKWSADEKFKAWIAADPTSKTKAMCVVCNNAPINGLPQDGGAGQRMGIRHRKAHVGGDFDLHKGLCIVCP